MDAFTQIGVILIIAAAVSWLMHALRQPLILGHILTGILVGPAVFNLLTSADVVELFSQLGITALLFIVGLSLSPRVMREVGKVALVTGIGQILFTSLLGFLIALAFGFSSLSALYIAVALTFSSTIIISKLLADRNDLGSLYGKVSIGFLLVQDVVATGILILVSSFVQEKADGVYLLWLIAKVVAVGGGLWLTQRYVLPSMARLFATSQEFLFLFSVAWGVGLALAFHGIGFSLEIGALAAGLSLAASPYHHEITAKMKLLRDFFLVLFFVLLGSKLTFQSVSSVLPSAALFTFFILIGNPLVVIALMGLLGYHRRTSFMAGLTVAQISEFSFLLILLGMRAGHLGERELALVTVVGLSTIAGSVYLIRYADRIYPLVQGVLRLFERRRPKPETRAKESYEMILFGCRRVGGDFLEQFKRAQANFLVVDFDPATVDRLAAEGVPHRYGDAADNEFFDELDLRKTRLIISTLPDVETNAFLLAKARHANKQVLTILTAQGIDEALLLYEQGASYVILPHYIGGNYAALLLERHGLNPKRFDTEKKRHVRHLTRRRFALASRG